MSKRDHYDGEDEDDATSRKVPRIADEELEEQLEELEEQLEELEEQLEELENESGGVDSGSSDESSEYYEADEFDNDEETPKSKLLVEKNDCGSVPPESPEAEEDKKAAIPPEPKNSDLKINPKNYVPPNKGERSQPSTTYAHSDEDSDLEGQPKKEFSEERVENQKEGYTVKKPSAKRNKSSAVQNPPKKKKSEVFDDKL